MSQNGVDIFKGLVDGLKELVRELPGVGKRKVRGRESPTGTGPACNVERFDGPRSSF